MQKTSLLRLALAAAVACSEAGCPGTGSEVVTRPAPGAQVGERKATMSPLSEEAAAGVDDAKLAGLLRDHWEWWMEQSPVWATTLGDHRFDDRLPPNSQADIDAAYTKTRIFLAGARALPRAEMSAADQITLDLFIFDLENSSATEVCNYHKWTVSARDNPVVGFNTLPERHKIATVADANNLLERYRKIPHSVGNSLDNLRAGLREGLVADAESLRRTIEMIDAQLAKPIDEWSLLDPIRDPGAHRDWSESERAAFARDLRAVVQDSIKPAYQRYRELLDELLPAARTGGSIGIGSLPSGAACYEASIRSHTGLSRTAADLHALGLAEIERINAQMNALGGKLFKTRSLPKLLAQLRTDETLYFSRKEQIVDAARAALAAAKAKIPDYFGVLPKADCVVVEIPDYEAPYTTIAYYREPHYDGSKPGEYFINTFKPEVRPRFEMQVLAFHESIPGHHLQIAIQQELGKLPAFRKFGGSTAFVEGWALYTERLADEMGLYSGDLDRMGMLSYDAWRASRLVVDTGIHAMGWTRERAETFMLEHTALTDENIRNEVDRYISWPGQALAYKVGQLEIMRLRDKAMLSLGHRYDARRFHDVVLGRGAVTLPVLEAQVLEWIEREKAAD